MIFLLIAVVAYLLGSIPFGYILVRIFRGEDVRKSGSGNIGATNVARSSPGLGGLTLLLDAGKGVLAVEFALQLGRYVGNLVFAPVIPPQHMFDNFLKWLWPLEWYQRLESITTFASLGTLAAFFAIIGHLYPIWLKFRGGKGVATAIGSLVVIAPKSILCVIGIFILVFLLFRYVSLSSVIAVACFPLAAWFFRDYGNQPLVLAMMSFASLLILWKHRANLQRLLHGTEPKFSRSRT